MAVYLPKPDTGRVDSSHSLRPDLSDERIFQRSLIDVPMFPSPREPDSLAHVQDMGCWTNQAAKPARSWFARTSQPGTDLLMFHGNVGLVFHCTPVLRRFSWH